MKDKYLQEFRIERTQNRNIGLLLLVIILGTLPLISCSRKIYPAEKADNVILELRIDNKKFEHLSLFGTLNLSGNCVNGWETPGTSIDGYKWTFVVPDSINRLAGKYFVRTQPFDFGKNEEKILAFSADKVSDRKLNVVALRDKITYIEGTYTSQQISDTIKDLGHALVDTFIMNPIITSDVIDIELKDNVCKSELEIQLAYPYFERNKLYTFDERLEIIKKYPYSIYLFDMLPYLTKELGKKSLNLLFESFSSEIRQSKSGKEVFDFINVEIMPVAIDTLSLANAKDGIPEAVIRTYNKYTLIIFSASWCSPCHKQIPLLKEVFNNCKKSLDMVYISADQKDEEQIWNRMLEKEQIPWRSLFARDYRKGLYKYYAIDGIPYSLLVHPDGKKERIDVRIKADRDRLYELTR